MEHNQIIYALVARGTAVLSECFTDDTGNAAQVTRMLLNKIPADEAKMSYESNNFMVHYIVKNAITYLCVAGEHMHMDLAFDFLKAVQERFEATYAAYAQTLQAYQIDEQFQKVIGGQIDKVNEASGGEDIAELKEKVTALHKLAHKNLDRFLDRDEQINIINDKSHMLTEDAEIFEKGANDLRRHFCWKYIKVTICLCLVLMVVIYLVISMMCGFDFKKCT